MFQPFFCGDPDSDNIVCFEESPVMLRRINAHAPGLCIDGDSVGRSHSQGTDYAEILIDESRRVAGP